MYTSKLVVASLLTKTVKCFSVVRFDSAVSPTFECKRDGTIRVVLNTQPCNGQLEKNCKGNEKRERERPCQKKNGSRREKKNEHGESKTDKGCQNRPSQSIEEMEEKKNTVNKAEEKKRNGGNSWVVTYRHYTLDIDIHTHTHTAVRSSGAARESTTHRKRREREGGRFSFGYNST